MITHEAYIQEVARVAALRLSPAEQAKLSAIKLAYGSGAPGTYGVTYFNKWGTPEARVPFVELSAFHQQDMPQLVATVLHELAHVLAGWEAGHGPDWKAAAKRLGMNAPKAAGHRGAWCNICLPLRLACVAIEPPTEGAPVKSLFGRGTGTTGTGKPPKPCGGSKGVKGGKSYGANRWAPWTCKCGFTVRAARVLSIRCNECQSDFVPKG